MRLSDRQTGQGRNSGKLQPPQTRALSGFAAWHCGHRILVIPHCRYFSVQPPAGCHKRPNASRTPFNFHLGNPTRTLAVHSYGSVDLVPVMSASPRGVDIAQVGSAALVRESSPNSECSMNRAFSGHSDAVAFARGRQGAICHDYSYSFLPALVPPKRDLSHPRRAAAGHRLN